MDSDGDADLAELAALLVSYSGCYQIGGVSSSLRLPAPAGTSTRRRPPL